MKEKSNVKANILWNTGGTIFYCIAQWLITILVVKLDSFEASGQLSLAMSTSSSFSAITLFSMRNYQISDVEENYKTAHYIGSRVITCVLSFVLCMGYSLVNDFSSHQFWCIVFFMLIRLVEGVADVLHGINQKYERYDVIGKSFIARGLVTISIFTAALCVTHNMVITLGIMALGNALIAIFWDIRSTWKLERLESVIKDKKVMELLLACVPIAIFSFFLSMENLIPKTYLQEMFGEEALGIYASISSPTLVVQVGAQVVFSPLLPMYIRVYNSGDYEKFRKMFHRVILAIVGAGIIVSAAASIVGRWGLNLLFGEVILDYYHLFMPIVWSTICMAFIWILQSIVIGIRCIFPMLIGMSVDFLVCLLSTKWFLRQFNWNGASIVQIVCLGGLAIYLVVLCEMDIEKKRQKMKK